jgi:hypothetical protein
MIAMTDRDRDPHPDSPPEAGDDKPTDAAQAIENNDNARRGEARNQDDTAQ